MNGVVMVSLLVLTGFCAYAAMNHAFIAFKRPFSHVHLLFSALCLLWVVFELLHLLTYTAPTLTEYIPRLKWEIAVILLTFLVFPWFIGEYTDIRPRWLLLGITVLILALIAINVVQPFSLQFAEIDRLEHAQLPWGETVAQPVGRNGMAYFAGVAAVFVIFSFAVYALSVRYYRNRMRTTLAMLLAVGVFGVSGLEGMLVRMSVVDFIHLGPFGLPTMIIAMSLALNHEMQLKLRASENRYRSLVEQSPFSIQVLSPDGQTLQVNRAWETLWGMTAERIAGYNPLQDQQLRDFGVTPYLEQGFSGSATELPPIKYNPADNPLYTGPQRDRWVRAHVYPIKNEAGEVREVVLLHEDVTEKKRYDDAIQLIISGVSAETGEGFFHELTKSLAELFATRYAFIGVLDAPQAQQVKTISVYAQGERAPNITYDLEGTPCAMVVGQRTCVHPSDVQRLFPKDHLLVEMGAESYVGTPLFDLKGNPLGIIVLLDDQPMHDIEQMSAVMEIVAARVAAEIERNKADDLLRQQHRRLQEMVDDRTAELQTAIKELEAFSYSVSHDLRAPLRSIDGFSLVLAQDYATLLDDQGKDYLRRIRNNAQRMATLIDDLLQLSRVSRKDFKKQRVNLSALVTNSLKKQQEQNPLRRVEIDVAANVAVAGDPDLLGIAIDNLISNAWKYTGKTAHATIAFGTQYQDGKPVYFIKDNGAGFDMQYVQKIFTAFQRLHSAQEFEGTGIGLATVVRIIHRHGGEIWAEAQPNRGATFYFDLPDCQ